MVLDRDLGFSRGHQSDDEDQDEVDEEEVKDNKDDNEEAEVDDKVEDPSVPKNSNSKFSALVLARDLDFSRGHQSNEDNNDGMMRIRSSMTTRKPRRTTRRRTRTTIKLSSVLPFRNHKFKPNLMMIMTKMMMKM